MSCDRVEKMLSLFLYGELSFEDEEAVHRHLEGCADCRLALEREKALHHALDEAEAAIPPDLLADCRRNLRPRLGQIARRSLPGRFWDWLGQPVPSRFLRPAGAMALVLLGFLAARLTSPDGRPPAEAGPVATQVRYLEPAEPGQVRVVVDETRQRVLSGSLEDAAIKQLLLAAARDPDDPALRLDSVDILRTHSTSREVRQALLHAVQQDPNAGVRLKAIEGLKAYGADPETRSVLSKVLLSDDNLGVRAQAIDLLVQHREMALVGTLQQLMETEPDDYIRLRGQQALKAMNASLEPF
jgi:anti-sigma factor RsiW